MLLAGAAAASRTEQCIFFFDLFFFDGFWRLKDPLDDILADRNGIPASQHAFWLKGQIILRGQNDK